MSMSGTAYLQSVGERDGFLSPCLCLGLVSCCYVVCLVSRRSADTDTGHTQYTTHMEIVNTGHVARENVKHMETGFLFREDPPKH